MAYENVLVNGFGFNSVYRYQPWDVEINPSTCSASLNIACKHSFKPRYNLINSDGTQQDYIGDICILCGEWRVPPNGE